MSVKTPKISEIRTTIKNQLQAAFNQRIPMLPQAFNRVLAAVMAGVFVTLWKYAGALSLQYFVRFASMAMTEINGKFIQPLIEWGRLIGLGDPVPAVRAERETLVTVTNQVGSILAGEQLTNTDNGVIYLVVGTVLLDAATKTITIRAEGDQSGGNGAGALGNVAVGETVTFVRPLANVQQDTVVSSELVTGVDGESEEAYRQRVVDFFQKRPQGGAYADYEQWGEETAGIINTYPYTGSAGEVDLYSEATPESSGSADGIPTAAQLVAVKDSTELNESGRATRRPVNAYVNSDAITRTAFTVEITDLQADDLVSTKAKITEAVEQYFTDRENYIYGLSILPQKDKIVASEVSGAVSNVASAFGATFVSVLVKESSVVIQIRQLDPGEKSKASSVTFL